MAELRTILLFRWRRETLFKSNERGKQWKGESELVAKQGPLTNFLPPFESEGRVASSRL